MQFKERSHLRNTKIQDEAVSADGEASASSPEVLAEVVNEGGYAKQSFTGRRCHGRLSELERSQCMASKHGWLLLGANAVGDFKLKPMLGPLRMTLGLLCLPSINGRTESE